MSAAERALGMLPLEGRTIALLESRKIDELATMVRRLGGEPLNAPTVREVGRPEDVTPHLSALAAREYAIVIFLTGAGATAVLQEAERRSVLRDVASALTMATVAARGPKPLAALKRYGISAAITTAKPHTSRELLDALSAVSLQGARTLLVHYGERNAEIAAAVRARGARLDEVCPYEWALPEDPQPIAALIQKVLEQRVDAALFTSQVQCRHLFVVAREMRLAPELAAALNRDVIVGAIGPVCAAALREAGVVPDVMPASPNMASLLTAIVDYFSLTGGGQSA
jgi:uroporphyrinogen-III synthase